MKGNQDIDVRAQILIKYKDHVDIMCADKFSIYSNGTRYADIDQNEEIDLGLVDRMHFHRVFSHIHFNPV
ncbi:MAG: hypothetical protein QM734_07815 [Cyclobacteriaceae bacterium]